MGLGGAVATTLVAGLEQLRQGSPAHGLPLAEVQAEWVGDLVSGAGILPSYDEMRAQIEEYDEQVRRRYVASKRHTIQVDFHKYFAEIERERRASRARAQGLPATRSERVKQGVLAGARTLATAARNLRS